jgi:hypothetical protein
MVKIFELAFPQEVRLYYHPNLSLSSGPLSPILTVNIDGKECSSTVFTGVLEQSFM